MVRSFESNTFSSQPYFDDRGRSKTAQPIIERIHPHSRPIVSYYYPKGVGDYHYGERHPMKPHRLSLTNALVFGYGLDKQIHNIYNPREATQAELEAYHDHDYIDFLSRVTPGEQDNMRALIESFNCVEDCPIFSEMYDFCRMYTGSSLAAARKLAAGTTDIAINWSGGLHHAKRGEASGFCYVNDIVLAILELLRYHPRVLYIDIDIHHGDGVELAFYHSNRVMTVSFHKYTGDFFPGTGKLDDNGAGLGKHFSLNVPLQDGIDDEMYVTVFKTVIDDTVTAFRPTSIVLQCGADSLGSDRLGAFNLSIKGHGECVDFVKRYNVPLLILGGGGYTIKNVSRCWTYETSVLVGVTLPDALPRTIYDPFFRDSGWKLHPPLTNSSTMNRNGYVDNVNHNSPAAMQRITTGIRNKLRYLQGAPSVAMQEIPPDIQGFLDDEELHSDEANEEMYGTGKAGEMRLDRGFGRNEFYDGASDVDRDDDLPKKLPGQRRKGNASTATSRSRGTTKPKSRARGRGRGIILAAFNHEEMDVDSETLSVTRSSKPSTNARRGKAGSKGRGVATKQPGKTRQMVQEGENGKDDDEDSAVEYTYESRRKWVPLTQARSREPPPESEPWNTNQDNCSRSLDNSKDDDEDSAVECTYESRRTWVPYPLLESQRSGLDSLKHIENQARTGSHAARTTNVDIDVSDEGSSDSGTEVDVTMN